MATKDESTNLIDEFKKFTEQKGIDQTTVMSVLEESFRSVIAKMFGNDDNFEVIVNPDKGDCEIYQNLEVVNDGEVEDENKQICLSEALLEDKDCEVGEEIARRIDFTKFGRRALLNLRQTLASKILDLQKDAIYARFKDMEGELITAEVYQMWKKEILLVDADGNELILPKDQQIPKDFYRKGDQVRAIVYMVDNKNNNPKVYVSRTSDEFLRRLFEIEVPEIHDGLIVIRAIARIPGERAKIAVESYDDRIDPVGACVGVKGARIHGIVRELKNENIDVIDYTTNTQLFIERALSPAKISQMRIDKETKRAEVFLHPDEVSLAIGKGGLNIRLASKLTGYNIDVYRETDDPDDIYLDEFSDEVDMWVIEALKSLGFTTAKAVLKADRQKLIDDADLEEDTVDHLLQVLKAEYED
ncbi:MAG: transcription termination factor NusA [Muribaculaceae bacterium]